MCYHVNAFIRMGRNVVNTNNKTKKIYSIQMNSLRLPIHFNLIELKKKKKKKASNNPDENFTD